MKLGFSEFFHMTVEEVHNHHMDTFHKVLKDNNIINRGGVYVVVYPGMTQHDIASATCMGSRLLWEALDQDSRDKIRKKYGDYHKWLIVSAVGVDRIGRGKELLKTENKPREYINHEGEKEIGEVVVHTLEKNEGFILNARAYTIIHSKAPLWVFGPVTGIFPHEFPAHEAKNQLMKKETGFMYWEED